MVQSFFKQILKSLKYLHRIGFTHTDLKPENILLEDQSLSKYPPEETGFNYDYYLPNRNKIRIIDFGGAT